MLMSDRVLNVTNGEYFNSFFLSKFGGEAVPFCEAMMDGETLEEIYSDAFVALRSAELKVNEDEYRSKMQVCEALEKSSFSKLVLWFGKDTFCQLNLLTLLAYLEQISFSGEVVLNYIDDESFEVIEKDISVRLGMYKNLYKRILLHKQKPETVGVLSGGAIDLYFDYLSREGKLARLIRENSGMNQTALVCLLLENSKEYGLSDLQAEKLIRQNT